jgi:hypothetical protein
VFYLGSGLGIDAGIGSVGSGSTPADAPTISIAQPGGGRGRVVADQGIFVCTPDLLEPSMIRASVTSFGRDNRESFSHSCESASALFPCRKTFGKRRAHQPPAARTVDGRIDSKICEHETNG